MKKCPYCAEEIKSEAIKCKHCGEFLEKSKHIPEIRQTDWTITFLLAIFVGGYGVHRFYIGKIGSGIAVLLITIASFIFSIIAISEGDPPWPAIFSGIWPFIDIIIIASNRMYDSRGYLVTREKLTEEQLVTREKLTEEQLESKKPTTLPTALGVVGLIFSLTHFILCGILLIPSFIINIISIVRCKKGKQSGLGLSIAGIILDITIIIFWFIYIIIFATFMVYK